MSEITGLEKKICGICGGAHSLAVCSVLEVTQHIPDTVCLSKARLTLPASLKIQSVVDGSLTIVSSVLVEMGTKFGPYDAKRTFNIHPEVKFPLKIFPSEDYFTEYYLDNSSEFVTNWMYFVKPATCLEEQNLICIQDCDEIYYISTKDIEINEQLFVWYGTHYCKMMQKELLQIKHNDQEFMECDEPLDMNKIIEAQKDVEKRQSWLCKFCGKVETEVPAYATHIYQHYKLQLRKKCMHCSEWFTNIRNLDRHVQKKHQEQSKTSNAEQPRPATTLDSCSSAGALTDSQLGDPLMTMSDGTDIGGLELDMSALNADSKLELDSNITDTQLLEADNFLDSNFNFNINDERDVCEICSKSFQSVKTLMLHLVKHTGKFVCKYCQKLFARREDHRNHPCVLNPLKPKLPCADCPKTFTTKKALNHHKKTCHGAPASTSTPVITIVSQASHAEQAMDNSLALLDSTILDTSTNVAPVEMPSMSEQTVMDAVCLHLDTHPAVNDTTVPVLNNKKKINLDSPGESYTCEMCTKSFKTRRGLTLHKRTHEKQLEDGVKQEAERTFLCQFCTQKFSCAQYLIAHEKTHIEVMQHVCKYCDKVFARKQSLKRHYQWHLQLNGQQAQKFACEKCSETFDTQELLATHDLCSHIDELALETDPTNTYEPGGLASSSAESSSAQLIDSVITSTTTVDSSISHDASAMPRIKHLNTIIIRRGDIGDDDDVPTIHLPEIEDDDEMAVGDSTLPPLMSTEDGVDNTTLLSNAVIGASSNGNGNSVQKKPYACTEDDCGSRFGRPRELERHVNSVHRRECVLCKKRFNSFPELREHERLCKTENYEECPECHSKFKLRSSLVRHMRHKHADVKPPMSNFDKNRKKVADQRVGADEVQAKISRPNEDSSNALPESSQSVLIEHDQSSSMAGAAGMDHHASITETLLDISKSTMTFSTQEGALDASMLVEPSPLTSSEIESNLSYIADSYDRTILQAGDLPVAQLSVADFQAAAAAAAATKSPKKQLKAIIGNTGDIQHHQQVSLEEQQRVVDLFEGFSKQAIEMKLTADENAALTAAMSGQSVVDLKLLDIATAGLECADGQIIGEIIESEEAAVADKVSSALSGLQSDLGVGVGAPSLRTASLDPASQKKAVSVLPMPALSNISVSNKNILIGNNTFILHEDSKSANPQSKVMLYVLKNVQH